MTLDEILTVARVIVRHHAERELSDGREIRKNDATLLSEFILSVLAASHPCVLPEPQVIDGGVVLCEGDTPMSPEDALGLAASIVRKAMEAKEGKVTSE